MMQAGSEENTDRIGVLLRVKVCSHNNVPALQADVPARPGGWPVLPPATDGAPCRLRPALKLLVLPRDKTMSPS